MRRIERLKPYKLDIANRLIVYLLTIAGLLMLCSTNLRVAYGQEKKEDDTVNKAKDAASKAIDKAEEKFTETIEDNSFFIEEAYNQEPGVVQHIFNAVYFRKPEHDTTASFTQEWPFLSQKHQLSYTIPYASLDSHSLHGVGDILLNYRYQLLGKENWAAVSPSISLILPTGSVSKGLGSGSTGLQLNLPVSKRLSNAFITHFNAGMTLLPAAKGFDVTGKQVKRTLNSYNLGSSIIYLANKNVNLLFEQVTNFAQDFDANGRTERFNEYIFSPGARFAIDMGSLQIVPGIAIPISRSQGVSRVGVSFYLSLEHPFKKQ